MTGSHAAGNRVNEIDLLRFLAAVAVVLFHYSFRGYAADAKSIMPYPLLAPWFKYGYLGVDLFFMISGFVILMTASKGGVRAFVVSRAVRLYPAFWACCTLTYLVTILIGAPRYSASVSKYLLNMTMLSDFLGVSSIDGAYWSLFVEIKFYAVVVIVLALKSIHRAQRLLIFWTAASVALTFLPQGKIRDALMVDFAPFFIAGAGFYLIWSRGPSLPRFAIIFVSWCLALVQTFGELSRFEIHYNTSMSREVVAGVVTTFYLTMLLVSLRWTGFPGRQSWRFIGALTYPLYLVHQNIGFMIFNALYPEVNPHLLFWGVFAMALFAAFLIHLLVEKPLEAPMKRAMNRLADSVRRSLWPDRI